MSNHKISYIFKYDKQHNLYNYVEHDQSNNVLSYYNMNNKNNSLTRYDRVNQLRVLIQYEEPCKLVHRFEAGESWVRAVSLTSTSTNLIFPKMKKQFAINNENQIVRFSVNPYLLEQWR